MCYSHSFNIPKVTILKPLYDRTLYMGCDYYIDKNLYIYFNNDPRFSCINLSHEKGYYWWYDGIDEDDDGFQEEVEEYRRKDLEPRMQPILLYAKNQFRKVSFEIKYKKIIDYNLVSFNRGWKDIYKIVKVEERYPR